MPAVPDYLERLIDRWEPDAFDAPDHRARVRLGVTGKPRAYDVTINGSDARLVPAETGKNSDATLTADEQTWRKIGDDLRGGMEAYHRNRLQIRKNLHLGVGFLAATSGLKDAGRLEFHPEKTTHGSIPPGSTPADVTSPTSRRASAIQ